MAVRWVVCPVVTVNGERLPKLGTFADPGIPWSGALDDDGNPVRKGYRWSACIDDDGLTANWCLCFVRGENFSALDADSQCINLFESTFQDGQDFLNQTGRALGWNQAWINRIRNRMQDKGISTTGISLDTPLWQIAERIGVAILPNFTPRGTWVS